MDMEHPHNIFTVIFITYILTKVPFIRKKVYHEMPLKTKYLGEYRTFIEFFRENLRTYNDAFLYILNIIYLL